MILSDATIQKVVAYLVRRHGITRRSAICTFAFAVPFTLFFILTTNPITKPLIVQFSIWLYGKSYEFKSDGSPFGYALGYLMLGALLFVFGSVVFNPRWKSQLARLEQADRRARDMNLETPERIKTRKVQAAKACAAAHGALIMVLAVSISAFGAWSDASVRGLIYWMALGWMPVSAISYKFFYNHLN